MTKRNDHSASASMDGDALSEIQSAVRLLVKLKLKEIQGDRSTNDMILMLHELGCRPVEIANALGKTQEHVNPVISRNRKGATQKNTKMKTVTRKKGYVHAE